MRTQIGSALFTLAIVGCGASGASTPTHVGSTPTDAGGGEPADVSNSTSVTVTVSPQSVSVLPMGSETFGCTVTGSTNTACTWKVTEAGGGTITNLGVYTAPAAVGTYHIVAASAADPAATATATVAVVAQVVGSCADLPKGGTWENITPLSLNISEWCAPYVGSCPNPGVTANGRMGTYGTHAFVLDPNHSGTAYLGTAQLGIWKSTDCGSTWAHINSGQNGAVLDAGRQWTMLIDPTNSDVLYTNAGYGQGGIYKSTDGGVNWTQILPKALMSVTAMGFVEKITMDPTNNQHLLAGFHADCTGTPLPGATTDNTGGWGCFVESMDAGVTWSLTTSAIPWSGLDGPGQTMVNAKTWFYGTNGGQGLWRTTTGGVSSGGQPAWTKVFSGSVNGSIYIAKGGTYYVGGGNVSVSSNLGVTWTTIMNSPSATSVNGSTPFVDDGTTLYVGTPGAAYWSTPDTSPMGPFVKLPSIPAIPTSVASAGQSPAAYLDYDATHHLIYSSNLDGGFWRYVTQ